LAHDWRSLSFDDDSSAERFARYWFVGDSCPVSDLHYFGGFAFNDYIDQDSDAIQYLLGHHIVFPSELMLHIEELIKK